MNTLTRTTAAVALTAGLALTGTHTAHAATPSQTYPHLTYTYRDNDYGSAVRIHLYDRGHDILEIALASKTGYWGHAEWDPRAQCVNHAGTRLCFASAQSYMHPAEHVDIDTRWKGRKCVLRLWRYGHRTNTVSCAPERDRRLSLGQ